MAFEGAEEQGDGGSGSNVGEEQKGQEPGIHRLHAFPALVRGRDMLRHMLRHMLGNKEDNAENQALRRSKQDGDGDNQHFESYQRSTAYYSIDMCHVQAMLEKERETARRVRGENICILELHSVTQDDLGTRRRHEIQEQEKVGRNIHAILQLSKASPYSHTCHQLPVMPPASPSLPNT